MMKQANTALIMRAIQLYPEIALSLSEEFGPKTTNGTGLLSCDPQRAKKQLLQILQQHEEPVRKWIGLI